MRHCSPATKVSPLRPATMRESSWCEKPWSAGCGVSRRRSSPLFRLKVSAWGASDSGPLAASRRRFAVAKRSPERRCANKKSARCALKNTARQEKQRKAKRPGLVSIIEKTKRISGVSWGHAGSRFWKLHAHIDRRGRHRRRNLVVHTDYGGGHAVCWYGKSQRRESVADRSARRQRLQVPRSGTGQSGLRGRGCNGQHRRAGQAVSRRERKARRRTPRESRRDRI